MAKIKVAVVGAGIFGCATAIELAASGANVTLFDSMPDILEGTTARCQARLHSGYHYPRSPETALLAKINSSKFIETYPECVINDIDQYYAIASESLTDPDDYLRFCKELGLSYEIETPAVLRNVELCVRVPETFIDITKLKRRLRRDLRTNNVALSTGSQVTDITDLSEFEWVIWTTYGHGWPEALRFEVCEVPVVELGRYTRQAIVVLDGDYGGIDPRGSLHTLYHVKHTVRWSWIGSGYPPIPSPFLDLIKKAPLPLRRDITSVADHISSLSRFFWAIDPRSQGVSIYHGSLWSVRTVLPAVDATDERPTIISTTGNQIRVLSGKICTAVSTAQQITGIIMGAL